MPHTARFFSQNREQLYAFAYKSIPTSEPSTHALNQLLNLANNNNQALNLTGMLMYTNGMFFQYLEGSKHNIHKLYIELLKDQRHHTVTTLLDEPIDTRIFSQWSMKLKQLCDLSMECVPHLALFQEGHHEYAFKSINHAVAKNIIDFYASQNKATEIMNDFNNKIIAEINLRNN